MKSAFLPIAMLLLCFGLPTGCISKASAEQESTFLFWTPYSAKDVKIQNNLHQLNSELYSKCGGFSRWAMDGGWHDPAHNKNESLPGYFYLITCKHMNGSMLAGMIRERFQSKEVYILEMPVHRFTE